MLRFHGLDVLATPTLLASANLLTLSSSYRSTPFARLGPALGLTALAIVVWEIIAPLYRVSTADWIDAAAYLLGTGGYLLLARLFSHRQTQHHEE